MNAIPGAIGSLAGIAEVRLSWREALLAGTWGDKKPGAVSGEFW
jgi:hypothetical protein